MHQLIPLQRQLQSITAALSLFGFATGLVGVFIPLIILQSGVPLWLIPAFYLAYAIIKLMINYPVIITIQRFGAHVGLGVGFAAGACEMAAVLGYSQTHNVWLLLAAAAAMAVTNAFLWSSQHIHISRVMRRGTHSSSMATMAIINQFLSIIAPLLGGAIGLFAGPVWLLGAAVALALAALIPLRSMGKLDSEREASSRVRYDLSGAPRRDLFANFCFNIDAVVGVLVWPIYLAVVIGSFKGIGVITSIAAAVTVVVVWIAGKRGDRGQDRAVLLQGALISSIVHSLRLFATTPAIITLVSSAYKSSLAYMQNAWVSTYYTHAKEHGIAYVMSMEIACDAAYVFMWGLFLALALTVSNQALFLGAFTLAAVAAWGCLLISRQGHLVSEAS
jgi:hypothetical protein